MDKNTVDVLGEEFHLANKAEREAFLEFEETYNLIHPAPKAALPRKFVFWFTGSILTAVSGVLLSAFRTGDAFWMAAVSLNVVIRTFETIVAVIAVDGVIVWLAIRRAYMSNKQDGNATLYGLGMAIIISSLAGLFQSTNILANGQGEVFVGVLRWLLVIFMGLGATVIAWLAGDILGVQLVQLDEERKQVEEHQAAANRGRRSRLIKEWQASRDNITNKFKTNLPEHVHEGSLVVEMSSSVVRRSNQNFIQGVKETFAGMNRNSNNNGRKVVIETRKKPIRKKLL